MRGDFTRNTFDPNRPYSSVRMQQGRVQMDADWNEQVEIQRYLDRTTRRDVIGPNGTPTDENGDAPGFRVVTSADLRNLVVEPGRFYLDGILVENFEEVVVLDPSGGETRPRQPYVLDAPGVTRTLDPGVYLVYLHAFERHITFLEDGSIREVALGGPDHATRTQTCWQVDLLYVDDALVAPTDGDGTSSGSLPVAPCDLSIPAWDALIAEPTATLAARATPGEDSDDVCVVPPSAGYRGPENQLYRVEIFTSGDAGAATFVWSRENGSVAATWVSSEDNVLTISRNTTDTVLGFENDDWIELTADHVELADPNVGDPGRLLVQIAAITDDQVQLRTLDSGLGGPGSPTNAEVDIVNYPSRPIVRRWDGTDGAITVPSDGSWVELEDGVEVNFGAGPFVSGQHWLIPARTATRDVEWPVDGSATPEQLPPRGVEHRYTRLAMVQVAEDGTITVLTDCREAFTPLTLRDLRSLQYLGGDGLLHRPFVGVGELRAGVYVGSDPQEGVTVRFEVLGTTDAWVAESASATSGALVIDVLTDADGVARAYPMVTASTVGTLLVRASLVGDDDGARPPYLHYRSDLDTQLLSCGCCLGTAAPSATLERRVEVRAVHRGHLACPRARIQFTITGGGRLTFDDGSTITAASGGRNADEEGKLTAAWTVGPSGEQRVVARIVDEDENPIGEPVCFEASLAVPSLVYLGGDGQVAESRSAPLHPFVTGVYQQGVALPGVDVAYEVTEGSATLSDSATASGTASTLTVPTDSDGVARVYCTFTSTDDVYVRARRVDGGSGTAAEPAIWFYAQALSSSSGTDSTSTETSSTAVSLSGVEVVSGEDDVVAEILGAGDEVLWTDLTRTLRTRSAGTIAAGQAGSPPMEVSLGIPVRLGDTTLPGTTWMRLEGDRTLLAGAVSWRPSTGTSSWVSGLVDPATTFGRSTLPLRVTLRGDYAWAAAGQSRTDRNPGPDGRVGDLELDLVVRLPGSDPVRGFDGTFTEVVLAAPAPSLRALREGVAVSIPGTAASEPTAGATTATRATRSATGILRYTPETRGYTLTNARGTAVPVTWSTSRQAYVLLSGNRAVVFAGLPQVAQ